MTDNRRHFVRFPFRTRGRLVLPEGEFAVEVLDLSLKGALVAPPPGFFAAMGGDGTLHLQLDDDDLIRMEVTVVHHESGCLGLACREIDLDSVTHLRRLVELNLGDDSGLQRELRALTRARRD